MEVHEIRKLLERLRSLERAERTPANASTIDVGLAAIKERLSFLSRLSSVRGWPAR